MQDICEAIENNINIIVELYSVGSVVTSNVFELF